MESPKENQKVDKKEIDKKELDKMFELVENIIKKEKEDRKGSISIARGESVNPAISFFLKDDQIFIVPPPPWNKEWDDFNFSGHQIDEKDIMSLWMRLLAVVFKADAHVMFVEAYSLNCCGTCGSKDFSTDSRICKDCGRDIMDTPPIESEFSTEMLGAFLEIRGEEKSYMWSSKILRDSDNRIYDYVEIESGTKMDSLGGRFANVWSFESWMAPHLAANYVNICESFGMEVDEVLRTAVEDTMAKKPEGYKIIMFPKASIVGQDIDGSIFLNGKTISKEEAKKVVEQPKYNKNFGSN